MPTLAVGVDMFPQTHHKEMVLLFERIKDAEEAMITEEPSIESTPIVGLGDAIENENTVKSNDKPDEVVVINEVPAIVTDL